MSRSPGCILCRSGDTTLYHQDEGLRGWARDYYRCSRCQLIFVHPDQRLSPDEERKRYDQHENDPEDPNYRKFLSRLFLPMQARIAPESSGLDFGSGPGPTLSRMFEEAGHRMAIFDRFYADDYSVFRRRYDFISCSETIEHLYSPFCELDRLWGCLRAGGWLGIMTRFVPEGVPFAEWYYKNDETHVGFYSRKTFEWVAGVFGVPVEFPGDHVVLLRKSDGSRKTHSKVS